MSDTADEIDELFDNETLPNARSQLETLFHPRTLHVKALGESKNGTILYFDMDEDDLHLVIVKETYYEGDEHSFGFVGDLTTLKIEKMFKIIQNMKILYGGEEYDTAIHIGTDIENDFERLKICSLCRLFNTIIVKEYVPRWLNIQLPSCEKVIVNDIESPFFIWKNGGQFPNLRHLGIKFSERPMDESEIRDEYELYHPGDPIIFPFHRNASGAYVSGVAIYDNVVKDIDITNYTMEYVPQFIWKAKKLNSIQIDVRELSLSSTRERLDDMNVNNHFMNILESFTQLRKLKCFSLLYRIGGGDYFEEYTDMMINHIMNNEEFPDVVVLCLEILKRTPLQYLAGEVGGVEYKAFPWPVCSGEMISKRLYNKIRSLGGGLRLKHMDFVHIGRKINNNWGNLKDIDGRDFINLKDKPTKRPCRNGNGKTCARCIIDAEQMFQQLNTATDADNPNVLYNLCPVCRSPITYIEIMSSIGIKRCKGFREEEATISKNILEASNNEAKARRKKRNAERRLYAAQKRLKIARNGVSRLEGKSSQEREIQKKLARLERKHKQKQDKLLQSKKIDKWLKRTMQDVQVRLIF